MFRNLLFSGLKGCLLCAAPLVLQAQQNETAWFKDVTTTHIPVDGREHALDVVFLDVDGDRDLDAILALESEPNRLYLNDGKGKFTWKKGAFAERNHDSEHVRIADFNKDGKADIIFVAEDDQTHEYYLGKGDGTFVDVSDRLPAKSEANGLDVGDVNGDGLPDIIVGNSGSKAQDFLWINIPAKPGYFIDHTTDWLPAIEDQTQAVKLADLNGDGTLDVVVGNEAPPNRLLFNDGKGKFTEHPEKLELLVPLHTRDVLVFDANRDGHPDILFVNLTSNGGPWDKDPTARLLINDGKGSFKDETAKRIPAQKLSSYSGTIVDFNHDGFADVILSAINTPPFEAAQMQVLQNDGKGVFTNVTSKVIPATTVCRGWGIAVGDVNGDGVLDLMIGGWGSQVRLLLGKK
ncbi:FG-GAP repeat domain-containing protein [Chryseolinea lacunae]|uniref:VCBS repeat-containing protein n=1 Tax=Chryseolinea lacunae TaxID=2801331 RepID=A0ABS1KYZ4_9BACT|nr:VCBS repeat-containing protein [Chryseolinea lacunae]MBL0744670.1 VCBS repeat-containing protein [Chryseolinea lacunae]